MRFNIFELRSFSFNSVCLLLTRGFTASTCAFNLLTRAFNLPTRAFNLATRAFNLATRGFSLLTREFELVTCNSCFTVLPLLTVGEVIRVFLLGESDEGMDILKAYAMPEG